MLLEPPPFQEADRCDVCKCAFGAFRRRHHCRCCGRSLCHEHSSKQTTLPQFGIYSNVRVCADCISNGVGSWAVNHQATTRLVNSITDQVCRLDIEAEVEPQTKMGTQYQTNATVIECKCGMPLCICQAPATTTETASIQ
ncbi:Vacuolar protein sorting-associated protein 27 [Linum perenne]